MTYNVFHYGTKKTGKKYTCVGSFDSFETALSAYEKCRKKGYIDCYITWVQPDNTVHAIWNDKHITL